MADPSKTPRRATPLESPRRNPATSLVTWALALFFLVLIDAAITRTDILWGPTAFENSGGLRMVFPQTYQVLRKIYRPEGSFDSRVALLGNSRLALSIEPSGVERAIARLDAERSVGVSNLAIFGAYVGDTAVLARHLGALDPELVVLTLGGAELSRSVVNPNGTGPNSLLKIGWTDGVVPAAGFGERLDRWARTVWPLYRFREFAREAILDSVLGRPDPGPPPKNFETRLDLFRHLYGERAENVYALHQKFLTDRTLSNFVDFVNLTNPGHLKRQFEREKTRVDVSEDWEAVIALDEMLGELTAAHDKVVVLLMPENPLLDLDTQERYHHPNQNEQAAQVSIKLAKKHGVPVIDGRRWLPVDCFLDFHHPLFEPQLFEDRLSKELLNALDT